MNLYLRAQKTGYADSKRNDKRPLPSGGRESV